MTTTTFSKTSSASLRRRWRRQIGVHAFSRYERHPREGAALGFHYHTNGSKLVPLHRLTTVIVLDEPDRGVQLVGYRPRLAGNSVDWTAEVVMLKSLSSCPRPYARGRRLDSRWRSLLELALRLDHRLQQAQRHLRRMEHTTIRWPRLWSAFSLEAAEHITVRGEELSALCGKFGLPPKAMLIKFKRLVGGQVLLPADWIEEQGDSMWVELSGVPPRQATRDTGIASRSRLTR
ncbi:hypothetical protein PLANPX_4841 [Lacipirellula parvula]|uniref:Uncharacterized protein n=1 Tax=Lacipirellula parvula TaxID=2650471 RepID=A0A5K7XPE9_9BACT|nr:hypothetical protein PLANPX_4841 [Lacipirellula parvula]